MGKKLDSFIGIFEKAVKAYPDKPALIMEGQQRTYGQLFERAAKTAAYLKKSGVKRGDSVALISSNRLDYIETELGCVMAGAVIVKLNWRLAVPELHHLILFNHIRFCFFRSQDDKIRKEMRELTAERCFSTDLERMDEIFSETEPLREFVPRADTEILMHLHTSGTTGMPKTVRYSVRGFLSKLESCIEALLFDETTVFQMMSQLFHSACVATYSCLACGGTVIFFDKFDPDTYLASIENYKVTWVSAIPTVLTALLHHPNLEQYDLSSIKTIGYSTCPMPPALLRQAMQKFHCGFQESYGMTEMGSIVTILSPEDHWKDGMRHLNSVGRPIAGHEVKIIDEHGRTCRAGESGEIAVRGPGMMVDYYQMPEETKKAIVDGWYHTKDVGYLTEDGYLYINGRKNDMIISGGENIFPQEIENVLRSHPDIARTSVVGIPDEYWGEAVHACVVLTQEGALTEQQIRRYCRGKIAGYKIPKRIHIYDKLPCTATGKVKRAELIQKITEELQNEREKPHSPAAEKSEEK